MDPATWKDLGLIVQSPLGPLVPGEYAYDAATWTGTFSPSFTLLPGSGYIVTVGNVSDVAGNRVLPSGSWLITPLAPVSLAATLAPKVVASGGSAHVGVTLIGAPLPANVDVLASTAASEFVPLTAIPVVDGRASLTVIRG